MKSISISVWSGVALIAIFFVGCSSPDQTAQNTNQNVRQPAAVNNGGGGATRSSQSPEKDALPFQNNKQPTRDKADGGESTNTVSRSGSENDSGAESNRLTETGNVNSKDSGASGAGLLDAAPGSGEAKEPAKPKKRVLGPAAEATGNIGTDPGDTLPEIEGKDVDGIDFALSDYDGKVKMVDFWGDW